MKIISIYLLPQHTTFQLHAAVTQVRRTIRNCIVAW
ncbi:Protein of unknown function [Pyronema omphalodes CBS 100304]|uniref:Uncharacterized protein n=1 Tax=Pyronema omphalodes (strain CBS 100304) TaxID=1076935 RepID=U4L623_PYROM|nr:Protein of unknown function [Pyronema omphalodes CBS 100304]